MSRYIPFYHDNLQYGEDNHQVSRVFLSTNEIRNAYDRNVSHLFECSAVFRHQVVKQLEDFQSSCLRAYLQVLKVLEHSDITSDSGFVRRTYMKQKISFGATVQTRLFRNMAVLFPSLEEDMLIHLLTL